MTAAGLDATMNTVSAVTPPTTPSTIANAAESTGFACIAPRPITDDAFRIPTGYVAETLFMLAGNPQAGGKQVTSLKDVKSWNDTYFAGFSGEVSPIGAPDNVAFSPDGMMWLATDGAPNTIGFNDALHAVATTGPNRGEVKQFLSVPAGAETCGPEFTPDQKTLFVAVQHPGEDGGFFRSGDVTANAQSAWPDGANTVPRPASVCVRKLDGGIIGS